MERTGKRIKNVSSFVQLSSPSSIKNDFLAVASMPYTTWIPKLQLLPTMATDTVLEEGPAATILANIRRLVDAFLDNFCLALWTYCCRCVASCLYRGLLPALMKMNKEKNKKYKGKMNQSAFPLLKRTQYTLKVKYNKARFMHGRKSFRL